MKSKLTLLLFVLFFAIGKVSAQLQPRVTEGMPSANVSNLGLYSETQVSKFTGIPDISIPLIKVADGNLNLSVGLSYHAGGIKPDIHPGWVGSGWSLQSGAIITRKINGIKDELPNDLGGFYDNHTVINSPDWYSIAKLTYYTSNSLDPAPDEFSFNIEGVSGEFYLDHLGNWQVRCDQDVKVIFDASDFTAPFMTTPPPNPYGMTSYQRNFGKFTLILTDGTKYVFGGNNNSIDYSIDFFNQNSTNWIATAWYLTKIISADGIHNMNLTYERDQYTNVLYLTNYDNISQISGPSGPRCVTNPDPLRSTLQMGGSLIAPVYLKSIETSKEYIQFDRSNSLELRYSEDIMNSSYQAYKASSGSKQEILNSVVERNADTTLYKFLPLLRQNGITAYPGILSNLRWKKLDKISLKDKYTNQVVKEYIFSYSNNGAKRLTLNSLKESNPSGSISDTIPSYRFYYDESKQLPGYLSNATDEWGYHAGVIPLNYIQFRNVNPEFTAAGTLRKIIYPTGGYKLFFFEPNDYSSNANDDHLTITTGANSRGGGLRIKAVYDYDPFEKSLKSKRYFYIKNFTSPSQANSVSSGILSSIPRHEWSVNNHILPTGDTLFTSLKSRNTILPS